MTNYGDRIIEGVIAPFGQTIYHPQFGWERYEPGIFAGTNLADTPVTLVDEDHKTTVGVLEAMHETAAGVVGRFRVSKTQRGDELLELAGDGALWGFSPGHDARQKHKEQNVTVHTGARLMHVALLATPAYTQAKVTSVRSDMSNQYPPAQPVAQPHPPAPAQPVVQRSGGEPTNWATSEDLAAIRTEMEQQHRATIAAAHRPEPTEQVVPLSGLTVIRTAGEYVHHAARAMDGDPQSLEKLKRASDEVPALRAAAESANTADFAGAVPDVFLGPIIDLQRAGAPTVAAMERFGLATPLTPTGMNIHRPKMSQGSTTAWEVSEGDEPANQKSTTVDIHAAVKTLKTRTRLTLAAATRSSPSALDAVMRDQNAALATGFNAGVVNGNGDPQQSTGSLQGLLNTPGLQSVAIANWNRQSVQDAAFAAEEAVAEVTNMAPLFWIMRTRRRSRLRALTDADGRPLGIVSQGGQWVNAMDRSPTPSGGSRLGGPGQNGATLIDYPIIADNTVPGDLGAGSDEDVMILVGVGCVELHHQAAGAASLMLPDDFQTTYGGYKMGAQIALEATALAVIAGPGLAV